MYLEAWQAIVDEPFIVSYSESTGKIRLSVYKVKGGCNDVWTTRERKDPLPISLQEAWNEFEEFSLEIILPHFLIHPLQTRGNLHSSISLQIHTSLGSARKPEYLRLEVCGVPQGLVLGPLRFVVYLNNLHETVQGTSSNFADDMTVGGIVHSEEGYRNIET